MPEINNISNNNFVFFFSGFVNSFNNMKRREDLYNEYKRPKQFRINKINIDVETAKHLFSHKLLFNAMYNFSEPVISLYMQGEEHLMLEIVNKDLPMFNQLKFNSIKRKDIEEIGNGIFYINIDKMKMQIKLNFN